MCGALFSRKEEKKEKPYDVFRDTNLRYMGYANEVGESFRGVVSCSAVRASYYIAFGYVVADTIDKGYKAWKSGKTDPSSSACEGDGSISKAVTKAGDALLWQTLASIIIPGIIINRICNYTCLFLCRRKSFSAYERRWIVVGVGLASIPMIVTPIDTAVTVFMNNTYRKVF